MRKIVISIFAVMSILPAMAQSPYRRVLAQVEQNSTQLNALRESTDAQKLANRTGIFLANPEVEFSYAWGRPSDLGGRKNLNVTQSFDFPTAYLHKGKVAGMENATAELDYRVQRMGVLLAAKSACIELIYCNAMVAQYGKRLENVCRIADTYRTLMDKGEGNILDLNRAQLNVSIVRSEMQGMERAREQALSQLRRLNGGMEISVDESVFVLASLPDSFEQWYEVALARNPMLESQIRQTEMLQRRVKLDRAMSLPKISAGYISEKVVGEQFSGLSVGISIPLWENRNTVRRTKALVKASQAQILDTKVELHDGLRNLYRKAVGLGESSREFRRALAQFDHDDILLKAFQMGQLSLLEYLGESQYHYEVFAQALELERDYELSVAELSATEL